MKAVSIKLRATDAGNGYAILAYSLTNAVERGEKEWEHMSIIAYGIFACCWAHMPLVSLSFSLSDHPFDFILNGRFFFFFFVRRDSNGTDDYFYDSLNDSLCLHWVSHTSTLPVQCMTWCQQKITNDVNKNYRSFFDNYSKICTYIRSIIYIFPLL